MWQQFTTWQLFTPWGEFSIGIFDGFLLYVLLISVFAVWGPLQNNTINKGKN